MFCLDLDGNYFLQLGSDALQNMFWFSVPSIIGEYGNTESSYEWVFLFVVSNLLSQFCSIRCGVEDFLLPYSAISTLKISNRDSYCSESLHIQICLFLVAGTKLILLY